ncbi:MAG: hypothetical protein ACYT04_49430, partial [Nostoc sp.]
MKYTRCRGAKTCALTDVPHCIANRYSAESIDFRSYSYLLLNRKFKFWAILAEKALGILPSAKGINP